MKKLLAISAVLALSAGAAATDTTNIYVSGVTHSNTNSWAVTNGLSVSINNHASGAPNGFSVSQTTTADNYRIRQRGSSRTHGTFSSASYSFNGLTATTGNRDLRTRSRNNIRVRGTSNVNGYSLDVAWSSNAIESTFTTVNETTNYGSNTNTRERYTTNISYSRVD